MFYHGSPVKLSTLVPSKSPLLDGSQVVFATPVKNLAVLFSRRWSGTEFKLSIDNGVLYLEELSEGVFDQIFLNQRGYIHYVDHKHFVKDKRLGMYHHEFISLRKEQVLHVEEVGNLGQYIIESERIELIPFSKKRD